MMRDDGTTTKIKLTGDTRMTRKDFFAVASAVPFLSLTGEQALALQDRKYMREQIRHRTNEEIFKEIVNRYVTTWNERDLSAWSTLFADNVDYVNRGGGWWQSNEENVAGHRMLFERNPNAPKTYQATLEKVAMLKDDIALLHVRWIWPGVNPPETKEFSGMMTIVLVRQDGKWLIRAIQNTVVT